MIVLSVGLVACPPAPPPGPPPPGPPPPPPPPGAVLKRPSKSSAIAITGDDKFVVAVNPENDSISVFNTAGDTKTAELSVGDEPVSVVIGPDDNTAFVAVRGDAKVVKINNIRTTPSLGPSVNVGSEPTGVALSPTGGLLVVAEFAESRVALVNTVTMTITASKVVPSPRAVAITNNGDTSDADEKVVVTEFYGRITGTEASDSSRTGAVQILNLSTLVSAGEVLFPPIDPGDFAPANTAPNQLASVAIVGNKFYATAVAASPDNAPKFNENVFPLILVGNVNGSRLGTISLADAIKSQVTVSPKNFMADLIDVAFVGSSIGYFLGRGADEIQRTVFTSDSTVTLGSTAPPVQQIDLLANNVGCQNPIGLVTPHDTAANIKMYVNCWVSRSVAVVDLSAQSATTKIASSSAPAAGLDTEINKGRRFYFTGRTRWSNESWSSCGSCHPDGLSDNITWRFAAGPRQSTSMDGSFSHGPGPQKQRIFNWSGIFDEMHDFERNTRDVSGGLGAITTGDCSNVAAQTPIDIAAFGGLGKPLKEVQDGVGAGPSCVKDFDEINEFVKTIRPPKARKFLDSASISRGLTLFQQGGCAKCHGGSGWTLSRRFFTPAAATNTALATAAFTDPGPNPKHTTQIQQEPTLTAGVFIAPPQVSCVLRRAGTFGIPGDTAGTNTLELKAGNPPTARAQGEFAGYNIPSLYGMQVGAPFLHHGQAKTLQELFGDNKWSTHRLGGNAVFNNGDPLSGQALTDLVNFIWSIDASTAEPSVPAGSDLCPASFP
jgi:DNA-binding beta-propeller fold protein YncE